MGCLKWVTKALLARQVWLLARQVWRLLINPNSLCAQVLNARYYLDGRLEDMLFAGNASSTWKAIQHGLELLKKGVTWSIGDGRDVRIWRDRWLPTEPTGQPITRQGTCRLRRVSDLLDEQGAWCMDVLKRYFLAPDITSITSIRTSSWLTTDFLA